MDDRAVNPWFVFYTESRHEKKVRDYLLRRGVSVFLPLVKEVRQWSDRKKKVEVPLFRSYIFVAVPAHELPAILETPGVVRLLRDNGQPARLREAEYETIQRLVATGFSLDVQAAPRFEAGEPVEVIDGPLKGLTGFVLSGDPQKFCVALQAIGQIIRVTLPPGILKRKPTDMHKKADFVE